VNFFNDANGTIFVANDDPSSPMAMHPLGIVTNGAPFHHLRSVRSLITTFNRCSDLFPGEYVEYLKSDVVQVNGSNPSSAGRYECAALNHTATTDVFIEGG
jgi:hypothetical protein